MIPYTPPSPARSVPVIDLSESDGHIAREIHIACRTIGFFTVKNHGVDPALIDAAFRVSKDFFDLPFAQKAALDMKNSPANSGYEQMGAQKLDSQDPDAPAAPPDLKEAFYCGLELPDDHPLAIKKMRGYGHNQWPAAQPDMRETLVAYYAAMTALGARVLEHIARSLELDSAFFAPFFDPPSATLRLIKYPPHPETAAENQIGDGAHTDWGGITLLAQDSSGGLEVRNLAGEWIDAPPIPGAYIINLGDLMARWTNDVYSSNMHRVKNNRSGGARYSIPFFMSPRPDAKVVAIPSCVTPETPPKYPPCTTAEHMSEMFRRSYGYAPAQAPA
ncbi:MAG: Isopenicillin synthase [Hyphomicrobiales bacterium]|nr:Isopenicillin synthase [Hyphomicrobiales bacterium]